LHLPQDWNHLRAWRASACRQPIPARSSRRMRQAPVCNQAVEVLSRRLHRSEPESPLDLSHGRRVPRQKALGDVSEHSFPGPPGWRRRRHARTIPDKSLVCKQKNPRHRSGASSAARCRRRSVQVLSPQPVS
jgi:hypothetical protein